MKGNGARAIVPGRFIMAAAVTGTAADGEC
jgi:hypothetical protein